MFGLAPEDYVEENIIEVLEENLQAILIFDEIGTQWRMGAVGPIGLDYSILFYKLDRLKLPPEDRDDLEYKIRVLEQAALSEMRKE